ncbi:MAG: 5'-nucleotidase C-terminal domain-containing protein [bacterium]|nr:5'-nucleotidase C-terminal domain-containing protein [bacterium]
MYRLRSIVALAALLAVLGTAGGAGAFTLTIFHNNDGESSLLPNGAGFGGAGAFVAKLDQLRAATTTDGQIMVSSGDNFLAGPNFSASLDHGVPFYDTQVMERIGYDAVCLGNHDFDFNPDVLADFLAGYVSRPKYVNCNLDFSAEPGLQAYVTGGDLVRSLVVTTGGQQIGIIGATTERLPYISSPRGVVVNAVAPAVQAEIDALTLAGVNKIILISHLQSIQEDLLLAPMLSGVDVMVGGGGSEVLANAGDLLVPGDVIYGPYPLLATGGDSASIPVVTTQGNYLYVGRLEVTFDAAGNVVATAGGPVRVANASYADGVTPDAAIVAAVEAPVAAYSAALAAQIIGVSEVPLDGVRTNVRSRETNEGNLVADAMLWQARQLMGDYGVTRVDVAIQNGGGIRNNAVVPAGNISMKTTFDILPFANFLCVVEDLSRENLKEILENCVSRVEFGDGRFGQVAGMRFLYDPSGTAQVIDPVSGVITTPGARIREIVLMDEPQTVICEFGAVVPGPAVNMAIVDFSARGGDQYPFNGAPLKIMGVSYQQALANYITQGLGGVVTAAQYPVGGEGRVIIGGTVGLEDPRDEDTTPDSDVTPAALRLAQNSPNPFNPSTTIAFSLDRTGPVRLDIFDLQGRLVRSLVDGAREAGEHHVIWDGRDGAGSPAASGTYVYRLQTTMRVISRSMTLVK